MEFLPKTLDGKPVYAGFWSRLIALLVDGVVLSPMLFLVYWMGRQTALLATIAAVMYFIVAIAYRVVFAALYGGTPGKLATGLRITFPDGSRVGWSEAARRSAVDCAFGGLSIIGRLPSLMNVSPARYAAMTASARVALQASLNAPWYRWVGYAAGFWVWAELIALLSSAHKRAIHDLIAGTVVVHADSAEQALRADAVSAYAVAESA
jgi:uncharacterized RDD family membrane protein YckC